MVCRQLGYLNGTTAEARNFNSVVPPNDIILPYDLQCSGSEANLAQCLYAKEESHNCSHGELVAVSCLGKYFSFVLIHFELYVL